MSEGQVGPPIFSYYDRGPEGMGGWLLLYCFNQVMSGFRFLLIAFWEHTFFLISLRLLCAAGACGAILSLFARIPAWRILLKGNFAVLCLFASVQLVRAYEFYQLRQTELENEIGALVVEAIRILGFVLIWWTYFHRSLRVRNTYGSNL